MSTVGLESIDHTVQLTNSWLKRLVDEHHFADRHQAYNALRAVIQALRDQLTTEQALHLSAQFPILVRGIYVEGWHIDPDKKAAGNVEEFALEVTRRLPSQFSRDGKLTAEAVFDLLWKELDPGLVAKLLDELPAQLRSLWPATARR